MARRAPCFPLRFSLLSALFGLALTTCPIGPAPAAPPDPYSASDGVVALSPDLRIHPLADGVWRFESIQDQGGDWGRIPANGLIVVAGDEAALIDTPWNDEQTRLLARWIEETLGARLTVVVPTHSHGDCLGGLAAAHALGARSYGHEATARFAREAGDPAPRETFTERLEISLGTGDARRQLVLRHLGAGHTLDNIVVWVPDAEVLFGGCLVKSATTRHMGYIDEADLAAWPATIRRVAAEYGHAAWIVPGHGRPGGTDTLSNTLHLLEEHNAEAIDRLVLLAAPVDEPDQLTVPTLFLIARNDVRGGGVPRLPEIREDYEATPALKELVVLEGSAHAQFLFETEQAERVMGEIVRFLRSPFDDD